MSQNTLAQTQVDALAAATYADGQALFPLSSAGAATLAWRLVDCGATLKQIESVRVEDNERVLGYLVERALIAHDYLPASEAPTREQVEEGLPRSTSAALNVAEMAIIAAATGHRFDNTTASRPSEEVLAATEQALLEPEARLKIRTMLGKAAVAVDPFDPEVSDMARKYQDALMGKSSDLFTNATTDSDNRHVQRTVLMGYVKTRLEKAFEGDESPEARALIHNLTVGQPDETVER